MTRVDAGPTVDRYLVRFPALEPAVRKVLEEGARLRRAAEAALPPPPPDDAPRDPAASDGLESLAAAAAEAAGASQAPGSADAARRSAEAVEAVLDLRAASHRLAPARATTSPAARSELVAALRSFVAAHDGLLAAAAAEHAPSPPWQLSFASHVAPDEAVQDMELRGSWLPGTPVARRAWGSRCWLTGRAFSCDSRRGGARRFRSLESAEMALSVEAVEPLRELRQALDRLAGSQPEAVAAARRVLPWLWHRWVEEDRHPTFAKLGLVDYPSLAVSLNNMLRTWAELPLLGSRGGPGEIVGLGADVGVEDGEAAYRWESYDSVRVQALRLAHALERLGLEVGGAVGIVTAGNCREFVLADLAAVFSRAVSVGLDGSASDERLLSAAAAADLQVLVADSGDVRRLLDAGLESACPRLRAIVLYGEVGRPPGATAVPVARLGELTAAAAQLPDGWRSASGVGPDTPVVHGDARGHQLAAEMGLPEDGEEELYALVFTSGSTGRPKGSPMSRRRWMEELDLDATLWPYVALSFQPQALMADRLSLWQAMYNGGRIGLARAGAALFDDARAVRPTLFFAPPAVWRALAGEDGAGEPASRRIRRALGGRVAAAGSGGAALEPAVRRGVEAALGVPLADGYGTTETGPIAADGRLLPNLDFVLLDLPELGYTAADRPRPRGELAVRTPRTMARYVGGDAAGDDAFTPDGYFRTGDIVELGPDRTCRVIGRRAEMFKLAGAEWVAPAVLEELFRSSPLVEDVFVTGEPDGHAVVAVVVPAPGALDEAELLAALRRLAVQAGRRPCEVPAGVVVAPRTSEGSPWTPASGLRTPSFKLNRRALAERYREQVRRAAGAGLPRQAPADADARDERTAEAVLALAAAALGRRPEELSARSSFAENGGDSVTAMAFRLRLEERLGPAVAAVPAEELVGRPLDDLARRLVGAEEEVAGSAPAATSTPSPVRPASPSDGGGGMQRLAEDVRRGFEGPLPPPSTGSSVLLTGGTGFLGAHLVPLVAGQLGDDATLYVLVRAGDDDEAGRRLREVLAGHQLPAPDARVVAVAGALDRERLGLDDERYGRLARRVGLVYHVGARVAGSGSYDELRQVNVLGTRRVLELALAEAAAAVHLVSSLDVTLLAERAAGRPVSGDVSAPRILPPEVLASASGYALSKWVAERLLAEAAAWSGGTLRLSVSRPALITWSSRTGAANASDWLTRILDGCLALAAVPGPAEAGVPAHVPATATSHRGLDLVPVDAVACTVEELGRRTRDGAPGPGDLVPTVHVGNPAPGVRGLVPPDRLLDLLRLAHWRRRPDRGLEVRPLADWSLDVAEAGLPAAGLLAALQQGLPLHRRYAAQDPVVASCPPVDAALMDAFLAGRGGG